MYKLLAFNRKKVRRFLASDDGLQLMCPKYLILRKWTVLSMCPRRKLSRLWRNWHRRRGFLEGSVVEVHWLLPLNLPKLWKRESLWLSFAIEEIDIFLLGFLLRNDSFWVFFMNLIFKNFMKLCLTSYQSVNKLQ